MWRTVQLPHDRLDERQFIMAVRRLADSLTYGSDRSPFVGAGMEYLQSRPYEQGDPVKSIDWRVTARMGRVYVKEYEVPKRVPIYILLDTSASMCVSSHHRSKYAWAVLLASGLALAGQSRMSPVGLLGCGEREFHVRPTLARNQVMGWAHLLRHHNFLESTSLGQRLRELGPFLTERSLLIVLSDLHDPDAVAAIKLVAQEHDSMVLQLQDPAERGRLGGGIFRAMEAETGELFTGHGRARWFDGEPAREELRRAGIDHLVIATDEAFLPKLRGFLRNRALRKAQG